MKTKIQYKAKAIIAGNFANFHRYGWTEVRAILNERAYFRTTDENKEIGKLLTEALEQKSVGLLNQLMTKFKIKPLYELPSTSKL